MSQQFSLFNLDKKQHLAKSGKLPELICRGIPPALVTLLLKPGKSSKPSIPDVGAWAGQRLICAGDHMEQCPAGIINEEEEAEVQRYAEEKESKSATLYHFASDTFTKIPLPSFDADKFDSGRQVWVLRNLSKRVYVRADVLAGKPGATGPFLEPFGFGDLLLTNITWSTDKINMDYGHILVLGPWAGDKFDIVPWDVAKKDIKKEKKAWKDVSEEQAKRTRLLLADLF